MIIGIGTDIIKTARFADMNERFLLRVYTPRERAYLLGKNHVSAAGLFAAKEAVAKALGTGFKGIWPDQIEVVHDGNGRPAVLLHGQAAKVAKSLVSGISSTDRYAITLSISHSDTDAIAFAIIEGGLRL